MAVAVHSISCRSHVLSNIDFKHGRSYVTRALAIPPSSVFFCTDESGNSQNSMNKNGSNTASKSGNLGCGRGNLLKYDATIGIIGGVCTSSTLNFVNKLVELSIKDGKSIPPIVLCSDPVQILPNDRSFYSHNATKTEGLKINNAPLVENLMRKRGFLESSGARCIVMPCHKLHLWYDDVSCGCSVPILHVGECVAKEIKELNLKPIEMGYPPRIGVLATESTLVDFYQDKLWDEGFEVVLPDKATTEHTLIPAIEALNKKDMEGAQNLLRIALQVLLIRAVNVVILASDEMRELLPRDDPLLKKCIDPMHALARSTINWTRTAETQ